MKPEAITIAAIELLQQIQNTSQPASEIINHYIRSRRYIGSKDRKNLTNLVWSYIRHRSRVNFLYPDLSLAEKIGLLKTLPEVIQNAPLFVNLEVPEWIIPLIPDAEQELKALLKTPDIILRANGNRDRIRSLLLQENIETEPTRLSPYGLILTKRINLNNSNCYKDGLVEVQDEGSQCVALETGISPNDTVLDYCAGAGGKSLIFAQMMNNKGKIIAHDISQRSLKELSHRAKRAKAHCIQTQEKLLSEHFHHVVVDAPCSGTGTWRRCPDARWKLTQNHIQKIIQTQAEILSEASQYVQDDGYLSYMTCSLLTVENQDQVSHFLQDHSEFQLVKMKQYSPAQTNTDGLFVAVMKRKSINKIEK